MRDHDVDVRGTHGVTVHEVEELEGWTVGGEGVGGGVQAVEPVLALLVGAELAAEVVVGLVLGVLEVVLAVGGRLPDVEDGVGDGLVRGHVPDHTVHERHLASGGNTILDDGAAELTEGSVGGPEGSEDGGGGGVNVAFRNDLVGDLVNKAVCDVSLGFLFGQVSNRGLRKDVRLETENIGDAVSLVSGLGRDLTDRVHKVHSSHPLVNGEFHLTGEVVQVADERAKDLAVARSHIMAHGLDDILCEVRIEPVSGSGRVALWGVAGNTVCAVCRHCVRRYVTYAGVARPNVVMQDAR